MAKKEQTTEVIKTAKTVEVKLLVPWAIVSFMIVIIASLIVGWHAHSIHVQDIEAKSNAKAAHMVQLSKVEK